MQRGFKPLPGSLALSDMNENGGWGGGVTLSMSCHSPDTGHMLQMAGLKEQAAPGGCPVGLAVECEA